ncbi:EamA family transporter [Alcaligenaceae bacterium CGII-47]|nr:EamA family transporter [Alcaligenaceae bacterium CGII-47]
MSLKDWLAALTVITVWGVNFVAIKLGLVEIPPLLLGALRFTLVAFPAVLFVPRPKLPWRILLNYGVTICLAQFIFLFWAINIGMPAGLASLVLQSQAFFTVLIAALVLREGIQRHHVLGMIIAVLGLVLIHQGAQSGSVPVLGFMLTLLSAVAWAVGNIVLKGAGKVDMIGLVVWGALIPPIPFMILSLTFEGPALIVHSLTNVSWVGVLAVAYLAFVATFVGYVLWGKLLARHPVSRIAPLSLLIPVIGMVCAAWLLDESMRPAQWLGGVVVLAGLGVNTFGARMLQRGTDMGSNS